MKTLVKFLAVAALFISGCTTAYQASDPYDDVYYSAKDASGSTVTITESEATLPSTEKVAGIESPATTATEPTSSAIDEFDYKTSAAGEEDYAPEDEPSIPEYSKN